MSKKANVFTPHLTQLFDSLIQLHYSAYLNEWIIKETLKHRRKILETRLPTADPKRPSFFVGSALVVPDYENAKPFVKRHSYARRHATDEELLELAEEVSRRLQGTVLCNLFEFMEQFLKSVGAEAYYQQRNRDSSKQFTLTLDNAKFQARRKNLKSAKGTLQYFREYVNALCRNGCRLLISEFSLKLPFFTESKDLQNVLKSLTERYQAIEFCRHHLVHAAGIYDEANLRALAKDDQEFIQSITQFSKLANARMILPTHDAVSPQIGDLSGLAFFLFRALTESFDMEDDYTELFVKKK